jgi:hypothetical protein
VNFNTFARKDLHNTGHESHNFCFDFHIMRVDSTSMPSTRKPMSWDERRERRRKIAEAIKAGKPVGETSLKFGVTPEQVRRACIEHGIKLVRTSIVTVESAA